MGLIRSIQMKKESMMGRERTGRLVQYNTWRGGERSKPKDHARIPIETNWYPARFQSISSPDISQCAVKFKEEGENSPEISVCLFSAKHIY